MRLKIYNKLQASLNPLYLEVVDDSHLHQGHSGNTMSGDSHFTVLITPQEKDMPLLELHRKIFAILKDEMGKIHALSIKRV